MIYTFFSNEIYEPSSYLLLSVFHKNKDNCGSYYKGDDGEYITSIQTGERFYNLYDFVYSIKGLDTGNENMDCFFYDEIVNNWVPVNYLYKN